MSLTIETLVESQAWSAIPDLDSLVDRAVEVAAREAAVPLPRDAELSCLFCDDAAIRDLNARWRGQNKPTNVLSFPAAEAPAVGGVPHALGDIALAFETVAGEAERDGKPLRAHVEHLVVHGFLHLLGFDHEADGEAERMEALETRIMARLGRPDPHGDERADPVLRP